MKKFDDEFCDAVADYIKNFIDNNNIEVADLAAAANVDRKQIYRLINRENVPLLSTFIKIALALGIQPSIKDIDFDFEAYKKKNQIFKAESKK